MTEPTRRMSPDTTLGEHRAVAPDERAAQYAAIEATAVEIDEEDLDAVLEQLREARHAVAKRRHRG
jgi:hypothetical protein